MNYRYFCFEDYQFDSRSKTLTLKYSFDSQEFFEEEYIFDCDFAEFNNNALDQALQLLFFMAGISYFKAYLPNEIKVNTGSIDNNLANFLNKTYIKGLGEFFYQNSLPPDTKIDFPINTDHLETNNFDSDGVLVAIGGGKDSIVSTEKLRGKIPLTTWSLGHKEQLNPLIQRLGTNHIWVHRQIDPKLFEHNNSTAYNGHIPISAIFACVGAILAILSGNKDVVMSNEYSANEETMEYRGVKINHQYSKTTEFEQDFQGVLKQLFGDSIRYYSLLRPYFEIQISEIFSKHFDKYKDVFSSCNKAFSQNNDSLYWCGKCPKCVFTFLALSNFVDIDRLETLFDGDNLLLNPELHDSFIKLVDRDQAKHFECVGTVDESRYALNKLLDKFPEQRRLFGDLSNSYNPDASQLHSIPGDVSSIVNS